MVGGEVVEAAEPGAEFDVVGESVVEVAAHNVACCEVALVGVVPHLREEGGAGCGAGGHLPEQVGHVLRQGAFLLFHVAYERVFLQFIGVGGKDFGVRINKGES